MISSSAKWFLILAIRFYQIAISPWFGARCRYVPSCSAYAIICLQRFGPGKGSWLATKRILRCHPFGAFGFDPPPSLMTKTKES